MYLAVKFIACTCLTADDVWYIGLPLTYISGRSHIDGIQDMIFMCAKCASLYLLIVSLCFLYMSVSNVSLLSPDALYVQVFSHPTCPYLSHVSLPLLCPIVSIVTAASFPSGPNLSTLSHRFPARFPVSNTIN